MSLGKEGLYLIQAYMLTPAIAALSTRLFFYKPRFRDAKLRFGRAKDYLKYWLFSLGITALSYGIYTILGAVQWDLTGSSFLENLTAQFALEGQDILDTLPPGFTPMTMLMLFFVGGLTVFNILPGLITGFGEEFGHRGFMGQMLLEPNPWKGLIIGGIIWYLWHLPLALVLPQPSQIPFWETVVNILVLAIGSICTHIYLSYVYLKTESVFVAAIAHITMNNAAASISYFIIIENQVLANVGLTISMIIIIIIMYFSNALTIFTQPNNIQEKGNPFEQIKKTSLETKSDNLTK
jgi:membrane protease YdiL (CAAX protease family)